MYTPPTLSRRPLVLTTLSTLTLILLAGAACNLPPGTELPPPGTCSLPTTTPGSNSRLQASVSGAYLSRTQAPSTRRLSGHVPAATRKRARPGRVFPDSQSMDITVALELNHRAELETLIGALHDPASPQYGHYLTPDEFSERFAPPTAPRRSRRCPCAYLEVPGDAGDRSRLQSQAHQSFGPAHRRGARVFDRGASLHVDSSGKSFFAPKYETHCCRRASASKRCTDYII